jgi:hypothetical protein
MSSNPISLMTTHLPMAKGFFSSPPGLTGPKKLRVFVCPEAKPRPTAHRTSISPLHHARPDHAGAAHAPCLFPWPGLNTRAKKHGTFKAHTRAFSRARSQVELLCEEAEAVQKVEAQDKNACKPYKCLPVD